MKNIIFALLLLSMFGISNAFAENDITLYQGYAVDNGSQHNGGTTNSYGAEIERHWNNTFNYSLGYFNYGTMQVTPVESIKRDLISIQAVYPIQISDNFRLSFQGGPALADTTQVMKTGSYVDNTHFVLVHGLTVSYLLTKNFSMVAMMQRTDFTQHTSDGVYLGLRFTPPSCCK